MILLEVQLDCSEIKAWVVKRYYQNGLSEMVYSDQSRWWGLHAITCGSRPANVLLLTSRSRLTESAYHQRLYANMAQSVLGVQPVNFSDTTSSLSVTHVTLLLDLWLWLRVRRCLEGSSRQREGGRAGGGAGEKDGGGEGGATPHPGQLPPWKPGLSILIMTSSKPKVSKSDKNFSNFMSTILICSSGNFCSVVLNSKKKVGCVKIWSCPGDVSLRLFEKLWQRIFFLTWKKLMNPHTFAHFF